MRAQPLTVPPLASSPPRTGPCSDGQLDTVHDRDGKHRCNQLSETLRGARPHRAGTKFDPLVSRTLSQTDARVITGLQVLESATMTVSRSSHSSSHARPNRADIEQDLTYCYLHMTEHDLKVIDTIDSLEYISGEISDDGAVPRSPCSNAAVKRDA